MTADGPGEDVDEDVDPSPVPPPSLPGDDLDVDLGATIIGGAETAEELRRLAEQARNDVAAGQEATPVPAAAAPVEPSAVPDGARATMMGSERDLDEIRRITEEAHRQAAAAKAEANRPLTADEEAAEIRRLTEAARQRAGRGTPVTPVGEPSAGETVWYPNPNPFPAVADAPDAPDRSPDGARPGQSSAPAAPAAFDLDAHRSGDLTAPATVGTVAEAARPTPMSWIIGAAVAAAVVVGLIAFFLVSQL